MNSNSINAGWNKRQRVEGILFSTVLILSALIPLEVFAQIPPIAAQIIRANAPVYDQYGKIALGNEPSRDDLGLEYIRGCMVEILSAPDGNIYPPQVDGLPDPRNHRLHITYIGFGIDPEIMHPGMFSTMLTPRPPDGAKIFVRVFNMPSLELASFYADSQIFTVSWTEDTIFFADIPHTSNAIDPNDDDGDGLNNSWERLNGSNPGRVDTDNDGFDDMAEFLAGTDADNWDSFLQIVSMSISNNTVVLQYMAGKDRHVEFQQAADLMNFSSCSSTGSMEVCPMGFMTVQVPVVTENHVQVFRLGVAVDEF